MSNIKCKPAFFLGQPVLTPKIYGAKVRVSSNVVLGNLGLFSDNISVASSTSTDSTSGLAAIFETNNSINLNLDSIIIVCKGVGGAGTSFLRIYNTLANLPHELLYESETIMINQGPNIYKFKFNNAILAPNSKYWIIPPTDTRRISWYWANSIPTELNNSNYTYFSFVVSTGGLSGPWNQISSVAYPCLSIEAS